MVKVYDGNNTLRRRIFRVVTVSRLASTDHLLLTALRAFHITKDPRKYLFGTSCFKLHWFLAFDKSTSWNINTTNHSLTCLNGHSVKALKNYKKFKFLSKGRYLISFFNLIANSVSSEGWTINFYDKKFNQIIILHVMCVFYIPLLKCCDYCLVSSVKFKKFKSCAQ